MTLFKTAPLISIITVFVLAVSTINAQASDEWVKVLDKRNIIVHTRTPEGSKIKEFKATTTIDTSLSSLAAVLMDIESFPRWYKNTGKTEVLEKLSEQSQIYYYEVLVSIPFKNRDVIQRADISQDPTTKVVTLTISNLAEYEFEPRGRVRMPVAEGSWTLTPQDNGQVFIEHQFLADPGGNIPAPIVNMLIVGGPYSALLKLNKFVKQEKYQDMRFDWLVE